jgi:hypothetical protein
LASSGSIFSATTGCGLGAGTLSNCREAAVGHRTLAAALVAVGGLGGEGGRLCLLPQVPAFILLAPSTWS